MMRVTRAALEAAGIYNSHGIASKGHAPIFVVYIPQHTQGFYFSATWRVEGVGHHTDPHRGWPYDGMKIFLLARPRQEKAAKLAEALAWAEEHYDIKEWERDPWGAYHPKGTLAQAMTTATKKEA